MRPALPRLHLLLLVLLVLGLSACAPEGPSAFVTFNVPPNGSCVVSPDTGNNVFRPFGLYDISPSGNGAGKSGFCERSYVLNLLVNSYLRSNSDETLGRAEPNILQINGAEVELMSLDKATISFEDSDGNVLLPNPFLVTTNNSLFPSKGDQPSVGIAAVEAIPVTYASFLAEFVGDQILAKVSIYGTTTGDVDVDFKPFIYPINICDGCLSVCARVLGMSDLTPEDVYGDECPDNAGADGRACIDPSC